MDSQATITPITALITVLLAGLCAIVPRRLLFVPLLVAACFVPADQRFMLGELDFQVIRILVIATILRLWLRNELTGVTWNAIDKVFVAWMVVGSMAYVAHWGTLGAVINRSGQWVQVGGLYLVFRYVVRSWADMRFAYLVLAVCAIIMTPFVGYELTTGTNVFRALGNVQTVVRLGEYRCQAAFPHSIIMGLFWAVNVPGFVGFAWAGRHRVLFGAAAVAGAFMVFSTASSTPILTLVVAAGLLAAYKWRHWTRLTAWGIVAALVGLHIVMKAPVWHLISRINVVGGSTGHHRYRLIDAAIAHFPEWALIGSRSTAHWGWGMQDVTNQYVLEGVTGGIVALGLFLTIVYLSARSYFRGASQRSPRDLRFLSWCIFVTILTHCVAFFGVSYFGQITFLWYMLLASAARFYAPEYATRVRRCASMRSIEGERMANRKGTVVRGRTTHAPAR